MNEATGGDRRIDSCGGLRRCGSQAIDYRTDRRTPSCGGVRRCHGEVMA